MLLNCDVLYEDSIVNWDVLCAVHGGGWASEGIHSFQLQ